jgi:amidase
MVDAQGYMQGIADRSGIIRPWNVFLDQYPLVLTPFLMRPTYDYDEDETFVGAKDLFDAAVYSYGINYMGLPAGNVPMGLIEGRPSGVQIVGQRFREDMILDALEVIEDAVGVLSTSLWAG